MEEERIIKIKEELKHTTLSSQQVSPADHWDSSSGSSQPTVEEVFRTMVSQRLAKGKRIGAKFN